MRPFVELGRSLGVTLCVENMYTVTAEATRMIADALNCGKLSGAALDVLANEPALPENPLLAAQNCIITPHMSWGAYEARERCLGEMILNMQAFFEGKTRNRVDL